jgi:ATP-binding cassette subfamily F protein 3
MLTKPNVLVLDEPTNHLDLECREALEAALRSFGGALLLVSHDRALLDAVGTCTVAVEDGTLRSYTGGWADYVRAREERAAAAVAQAEPRPKKGKPRPARPRVSKNRAQRQAALEREIEAAEAALAAVEEELADPAAWSDSARAAASTERHATARRRVEELYAALEAVSG